MTRGAPLGNQHSTKWLPEWDDALREFFAEKMSGAQAANAISARFGIFLSRNAIIGRASRIGVKSLTARVGAPNKSRVPRAPRPARILSVRSQIDLPALRCIEVEPIGVDLLDLEAAQCRWPSGDGPFTFCAHPTREGYSYCMPHFALSVGGGTPSERAAHHVSRNLQAAE